MKARSLILLAACSLLIAAGGKKGKGKKGDDDRDIAPMTDDRPAWAPERDPNQSDDPCPTKPPTGYRMAIGYGQGKTEAEAKAKAAAEAHHQLKMIACRGKVDSVRCASIEKAISPWKNGFYDRKKKSACVAKAIKQTELYRFENEQKALKASIHSLADKVVEKSSGRLLMARPARWATGCSGGSLGALISNRMRNRMALGQVKLVPRGTKKPPKGALLLFTEMSASGSEITVSASLVEPDMSAETPLPGFTFAKDLFQIDEASMTKCASPALIGIDGDEQEGVEGLTIELDIDDRDGTLCEGDRFRPEIETNKPSKVQLWNVGKDGTAFLLWPPPASYLKQQGLSQHIGGLVDDDLELEENTAISLEGYFGDETLVAVAIPESSTFGKTNGWNGFCKLGETFSPAIYPRGAAVARVTYNVIPNGHNRCKVVEPQDKQVLVNALKNAPTCR